MADEEEFKIGYRTFHNDDELIIKEFMLQIQYLEKAFMAQINQDLPEGMLHPVSEYIKLKDALNRLDNDRLAEEF